MELGVLGPLVVRRDGRDLEVQGGKERLLLARLAASVRRSVAVPELVAALWGESPPPTAAKSLQTHVLRLRNLLEPDRRGAPELLVTDAGGYRLALAPDAVDAERFAAACTDARRALAQEQPERAVAVLDEALALWRGPAYAALGVEGGVVEAEARRLEELRLAAQEDRCEARLALHRDREVVPDLERLLVEAPYRERLWELLVRALYGSGRQGEALAAYERARAVLAQELGLDPGPRLRELHERVLRQDPSLEVATLDAAQVRDVVAGYLPPEDVEQVAAEVVRESGGRPGRVHELAQLWARRRSDARLAGAVEAASSSAGRLALARDAVAAEVQGRAEEEPLPVDPGTCPWRGLAAYDVQDAPWYAGRERLVAELVARLASGRVAAVVGASGSGKSSLVRAGLLPALAADVLPGSGAWTPVVLRPGAHPLAALARASFAGSGTLDVGTLLERLVRDAGTSPVSTVLVVDQAEELWTACEDPVERAAFLELLTELATGPQGTVAVVLVLRADHLPGLSEAPALAAAAADGAVLVGAMTGPELRRAVEVPAARAGLALDVGLVDALVADAGTEPGVLPLLSTCLARLWDERSGQRLSLAGYVAGGGLAGAVARLADAVTDALPEADRDAVRVLLLRLAGSAPGGDPAAVDRRRVPLAELDALPDPRVRAAVAPLVEARLLSVSEGHVEVAHEALFREWPRLRAWLGEDAAGRQVLRRLTTAAAEWDAEGREPALLWTGTRLAAATEHAAAHPDEVTAVERAFLDASAARLDAERREAEERAGRAVRQNRRLRGLLGGLAVLLVLALVAGGLAVRAQDRAEQAELAADARRLAAVAVGEDALDRGLLQAVEAVRAEPGPDTDGALLSLLSRAPEAVLQVRTPNRWLRGSATPDGGTLVLAENEPRARAVDAVDGTTRWEADLPAQARGVVAAEGVAVAALPGGAEHDVVGLGLDDGAVRWRLDTRQGRGGPGAGLVARLPGGRLAVAGPVEVVVVDAATGAVRGRVPVDLQGGFPGQLHTLPGERLLLSEEGGGRAWRLDLRDGRLDPLPGGGEVLGVSPDGRTVAVGVVTPGRPDAVVLRDPATWRDRGPGLPLTELTGAASWSPDGSRLAVGDADAVRLVDPATGAAAGELAAHTGTVMQLAWTPGLLWSVGRDGTALAWQPDGSRGLLGRGRAPASSLGATSPDGRRAVAVTVRFDALNEAALLDPADPGTRTPLAPPAGCLCQPWAVAMTPDGAQALVAYEQFPGTPPGPPAGPPAEDAGRLVVHDAATGRALREVGLPWPVWGVGVLPDSTAAVVNGRGGWARVSLADGAVTQGPRGQQPLDRVDPAQTAAVSPDGRLVALDRPDGVVLADTRTLEVVRRTRLPDDDRAWVLRWTPDGRTLAAGGPRGTLRLLDRALEPVGTPRAGTPGWFTDIEPSPDGRLLATVGTDGDVVLWDARTGAPLGRPLSDQHGWGWAAFSPDGDRLRVVHEDGTRLEVPVRRQAWVGLACRLASRQLTPQEWELARPGEPYRETCA